MGHSTYGLTMTAGLWHATCTCGWRSAPSPDLAEQIEELDQHLRVVVIAEQRPTRTSRAAASAALQVVDHTVLLGAVVAAVLLPLATRVRRA